MTFWARIKLWWEGDFVLPENRPDDMIREIMGHYEQHWTSRLAHTLADFYLGNWRWIWGLIAMLFVGLLKFL